MEYSLDYEYRRFKHLRESVFWHVVVKRLKTKYKELIKGDADIIYSTYLATTGIQELDAISSRYTLNKQWLYSLFLYSTINYKDIKNPIINYIKISDSINPIDKGIYIQVTPLTSNQEVMDILKFIKHHIFTVSPSITNQFVTKKNLRMDKKTKDVFENVLKLEKIAKKLLRQGMYDLARDPIIIDACEVLARDLLKIGQDVVLDEQARTQVAERGKNLRKSYENYTTTHELPKISDCSNISAIFD